MTDLSPLQRIETLESAENYRQQDEDAAHAYEPAPTGSLLERVSELRQKFEQLIKSSRAYDGYSAMAPAELADRLIDVVLDQIDD